MFNVNRKGALMRRIVGLVMLCVFLSSLCGCSVVSDKTKTNKKEKKHNIHILGIPIWKSEKPVENPVQ